MCTAHTDDYTFTRGMWTDRSHDMLITGYMDPLSQMVWEACSARACTALTDIGTVVEHNLKRELTMSNKDPLSAKYTIYQKMKNGREGWLTDCDIVVTQTSDLENFYITGYMDASINGEHVFHRDYDYKVKRNGL